MNPELLKRLQKLCMLDKKDLVQKTLKTCEEAGELSQAVLSATGAFGCEYKGLTLQDVLSESIDTFTCAISVALMAGFSIEDIEAQLTHKLDRWEEKINNANKLQITVLED